MKASHERSYKLESMKSHSFLIFIIIFVIYSLTISYVRAEITEKEIGVPLYPGSRQIPSCVPAKTDQNNSSFRNITLITSDSFKKVLTFYQEKLGKFSTSRSQFSSKSALWNESTPKGYRIVTLMEAEEGTKITITKRIW